MAKVAQPQSEAVRVSLAALVGLNKQASGIDLQPKRAVARTGGEYLSRFKGRGMEFAESRPYQPGDDARNLHWRVMARTGKPFTKEFHEERERPVFLWIDLRSRMFFGTRGALKAVVAARAAALIAWAAMRHGDRIGGVIFSDDEHHEIKPGRGTAAVLFLFKNIVEHPVWDSPTHRQDHDEAANKAMTRLRRVVRPGSLVVLLSDFANFGAATESSMLQLARHNEVLMVHVYDRFEAELPPPGSYRLSDGTDDFVLDAADPGYRRRYQNHFADHLTHLRELALRNRISYLTCRTDEDPVQVLRHELGRARAS
jgi:uncharacterized protein (DUF58 family)